MVRINKQEIKGITGERKCAPVAESDNNAIVFEEEDEAICCDGDECQLDWQDNP